MLDSIIIVRNCVLASCWPQDSSYESPSSSTITTVILAIPSHSSHFRHIPSRIICPMGACRIRRPFYACLNSNHQLLEDDKTAVCVCLREAVLHRQRDNTFVAIPNHGDWTRSTRPHKPANSMSTDRNLHVWRQEHQVGACPEGTNAVGADRRTSREA